jgi:mRNA-degrading endonuclease RelE of RelBE toxin-antitoxin system
MGSYKVGLTNSASAEFRAVPFPFRRQINQRMMRLQSEPRPSISQHVESNRHRIRSSNWWILYEINDEAATVTGVAITKASLT